MLARRTGAQSRRGGRGGAVSGGVVIPYSLGAFSRSSIASYLTDSDSILSAPTNELRLEDRGDGYGPVPVFEGPFTQDISAPNTFESWTAAFSAVATDNAIVGPDGTKNAAALTLAANSNSGISLPMTMADNARAEVSVWAKVPSGTTTIRVGSTLKTGSNSLITPTLTTKWQRLGRNHSSVGSGATQLAMIIINSEAAAKTVHIAYAQAVEESLFPLSNVGVSLATKASDVLVVPTAAVPSWFYEKGWEADLYPYFADTDTHPGTSTKFFYVFRMDNSNYVYFDSAENKFYTRIGGNTSISSAKTFSRHQKLTLKMDFENNTLTFSGFTTGDEVQATHSGGWPAATELSVGKKQTVEDESWYGRISEPRRWK